MRQENCQGIVSHEKVLVDGVEEVLASFLGGLKVCILTHGHMYEGDIAKSTCGRLNVCIFNMWSHMMDTLQRVQTNL